MTTAVVCRRGSPRVQMSGLFQDRDRDSGLLPSQQRSLGLGCLDRGPDRPDSDWLGRLESVETVPSRGGEPEWFPRGEAEVVTGATPCYLDESVSGLVSGDWTGVKNTDGTHFGWDEIQILGRSLTTVCDEDRRPTTAGDLGGWVNQQAMAEISGTRNTDDEIGGIRRDKEIS